MNIFLIVQVVFHTTHNFITEFKTMVEHEFEIVIIGGGIIGCTTAYYITKHPFASELESLAKITLIEASKNGPAQGASGRAGGLVARWAYPKEIVDVSFDEHVKLAEEHNGKDRWGWRFVACGSWEGRGEVITTTEDHGGISESKSLEKTLGLPGGKKPNRSHKTKRLPKDLLWVKEDLTDVYSPMAKDGETAQVHPYQFTISMFELAKERGLNYINGQAMKILVDDSDGKVTGVEYIEPETKQTKTVPATHVIVAAGAWSPQIVQGLPISAVRAHSITVHPKQDVTIAPYVVFTEIRDPVSGTTSSPEIYARPDNEVYACGPGDGCPLPNCVDDVVVDEKSCDRIYEQVCSISQEIREGTVDQRQACFLPIVSTGGGPIIREAINANGLFIGTGHTCWVSHIAL